MGEGGGGEEKGRFLSFSSLPFSLPIHLSPFPPETPDTQVRDLRTLNNVKSKFSFNEMNKNDLPAMYSAVFWCLLLVLLFFGFIA